MEEDSSGRKRDDGVRPVVRNKRIEYVGISDLIGFIIRHGHATHWELNHLYSLEDAYDIWEADYVNDVNDYFAEIRKYEILKKKNEKEKGRDGSWQKAQAGR